MSGGSEAGRPPGADIVGREAELARLAAFLAGSATRTLVLQGEAGIGKTVLWEAALELARARRMRVVSARPSDAEARLAFAGLGDLLDGVDLGAFRLPGPQRRALEVALLRAEPAGRAPEPQAIALGFLGVLRELSGKPLLVAIDDVQWLDRPSAEAFTFAARRLRGEPVRFLLARRPGASLGLERALAPGGLECLELGGLSLGATRRMLHDRLGLSLPRRTLRRIVDSAQGNPLFALELGRALAEQGAEPAAELPVPEVVEELFGRRVAKLPARTRRLLLAVALSPDPRIPQLERIGGAAVLEDAREAGILVVERDRVRPAHPLLAAAARQRSRPGVRRELHLELARSAAEPELRARHLALAADGPEPELAATLAAAAGSARARGAVEEAVELAEQALRLTPHESAERVERVLDLADHLLLAGRPERAAALVSPVAGSLPQGAALVRARLLLADSTAVATVGDHDGQLELALEASGGDPVLRAPVLVRKVEQTAIGCVERISAAEAWALEALEAAEEAGPEVRRLALHALGWTRILRGEPVDRLCDRSGAVGAGGHLYRSLARAASVRLAWRGEVRPARASFTRLLSLADERGEAWSYLALRLHLCELELRAGEWTAAERLLDEWDESLEQGILVGASYARCRALLAAGRGLPEEAERWVAEVRRSAEETGLRWDLLEALRARGLAALVAREPERAAGDLGTVWEHTRREGVEDLGAFPAAPDLVEALAELGDTERALEVTSGVCELAERRQHPWGLATAARCGGLVRLAAVGWEEQAAAGLERAAAAYESLGLRFDAARSLLALGRAGRGLRKWGAARQALERATAAFEELGSPGWAEQARSELARVGARRPSPAGELTPAERRVAALAAEGLSNKQIAQILVVSVHTVEVHLSHAYAKLGVRTRSQLARLLAAGESASKV